MDAHILDRYNSRRGAASYTHKFEKHWTERLNNVREQKLVRRLLGTIPKSELIGPALDLPCGYGRLSPLVREVAPRVVMGDWSFHLLREAAAFLRQEGDTPRHGGFVRGTALCLPFPDRVFDLVLSVRLCHHISSREERLAYVGEILRISNRWVLFTYFDTDSFKNLSHERRRKFKNKRPKWTLTAAEVAEKAEEAGYEVVESVPLSRLFSGHRYTMLRRDGVG